MKIVSVLCIPCVYRCRERGTLCLSVFQKPCKPIILISSKQTKNRMVFNKPTCGTAQCVEFDGRDRMVHQCLGPQTILFQTICKVLAEKHEND